MKKGLLQVLGANIISLLISVLTNFLIPKYLSIDSYAMYKTYALYVTYAGFFSLGYNDGMYLKYGGQDLDKVDKKELANNYKNYLILILVMMLLVLLVGIFIDDPIIISFSFGLVSYNVLGYLKSLYQATGEFGAYSKALIIEKIGVFFFTILLLFVFKSDNYLFYICSQVVVGIVVALYLTIRLEHKLHFLRLGIFSMKEYKENISSGIVLMLGNFSSGIFTGLDRWFVKFLMQNIQFALYSFASSLLNLMNVFITPITISLYNYFCKGIKRGRLKKLKRLVLAWGFLLAAAAYPVKFILEVYLNKYVDANSVIFLLFGAQAFVAVIQGIYVNLYKAKHQQKRYLSQMIIMIIVGFLTNAFFYYFHKTMEAFAWATLFTYIIWFIICEIQNKDIAYKKREYFVIVILLATLNITGTSMNPIAGFFLYLLIYAVTITIGMPSVIKFAAFNSRNFFRRHKEEKSKLANSERV